MTTSRCWSIIDAAVDVTESAVAESFHDTVRAEVPGHGTVQYSGHVCRRAPRGGVRRVSTESDVASRELTYAALVRGNRNFRFLWLGQVVSQLGDWFNAIAVYALLLDVTGSATAVATMMVVQQLPNAFLGPWAGAFVDRFDRRRVMIVADVCRAVIVLGLLFVDSASAIWLAYVIVGGAVLATSFFEPARSAILPSLVSRDELLPANSLVERDLVGDARGRRVDRAALSAQWFGRDFAFVLNSLSFLASALFLAQIRPPASIQADTAADAEARDGGRRFAAGFTYLLAHRRILAIVSIKGAWAMAGGVLLLLTVFGERVFRMGDGAAAGIGDPVRRARRRRAARRVAGEGRARKRRGAPGARRRAGVRRSSGSATRDWRWRRRSGSRRSPSSGRTRRGRCCGWRAPCCCS